MTTFSTHVLDTSNGLPVPGLMLSLSHSGRDLFTATTDGDGRYRWEGDLPEGIHILRFQVGDHFKDTLYPYVDVAFTVNRTTPGHLHIPLLLSPYGYSTYRGS